ncbi:cyclin-D1-binding protein 1 homolog isoform X2 [Homalodisca vitripennis]|uniref:cyclin-D1-binding protein 1 homolog isoform X2 n=1 Tax=Homalodisca vitripennis TaxID=197043 RepID=UPI001EEC1F40|nr:cyclin-D1-binding protein 1 homolog isoform X2 [Homalodisca vitripennis]
MSTNNLVDALSERIKFDLDKLQSNELEKIELDSFNLSYFWSQFGAAVQGLSNEVTKIGFACGQQPYPASGNLAAMLQDLVQSYTVMRDLYLVLPEEVGATVYQAVTSVMIDIVAALLAVVRSLSDLSEKGAKERLTLTGTFWEACAAVETLPRNNLLATLGVIDGELGLAVDAQEELTTTIEENCEMMSELGDVYNSELWTNSERDLVTKAVGLVKVTQVCLQRVHKAVGDCGSCSTPQNCAELDATATASRTISPVLDDFVSELYQPIDVPKALENAGKLAALLRNMLMTVENFHFKQAINKDVINKLLLFISHNHKKLDPSVAGLLPQLSNLTLTTEPT